MLPPLNKVIIISIIIIIIIISSSIIIIIIIIIISIIIISNHFSWIVSWFQLVKSIIRLCQGCCIFCVRVILGDSTREKALYIGSQ